MKQLFLAASLAVSMAASAANPQPIALEQGAFHPVLSPDGSTILFSTPDHQGLKALDRTSGSVTLIDEGVSAGFDPVFSADGSRVYYRTASMHDGLLYRDIRSYAMTTGRMEVVAEPSRRDLNLRAIDSPRYAYATYRSIAVCTDGAVRTISPLPDAHSYLWASLSADGSELAFSEPFTGVYVSSAAGEAPRRLLSKGDFVCWAGPHTLVAVVSHDDGYVVTESYLVAIDTITGASTRLTDADMLVGEATAAASGEVIFTDLDGHLYSLNINDK